MYDKLFIVYAVHFWMFSVRKLGRFCVANRIAASVTAPLLDILRFTSSGLLFMYTPKHVSAMRILSQLRERKLGQFCVRAFISETKYSVFLNFTHFRLLLWVLSDQGNPFVQTMSWTERICQIIHSLDQIISFITCVRSDHSLDQATCMWPFVPKSLECGDCSAKLHGRLRIKIRSCTEL